VLAQARVLVQELVQELAQVQAQVRVRLVQVRLVQRPVA
jgi:hypothetical protein